MRPSMIALLAVAGLSLGVLVNLLADSVPRTRKPAAPRCHACGAPRPWPAWSALVGLAAVNSRCRYCGAWRGWRAVAVELAAIAGTAMIYLRDPAGWPVATGIVAGFVFLLITVIDVEHRLILHVVSLPSAVALGVLRSLDPAQGPVKTLAGGAAGFLALLVMYLFGQVFGRWIASRRGRPIDEVPFGFGDVMLGGVLGLALGWPGIVVGIFLGIFAAGLFSLGFLLVHLARRRYAAFLAIPYGPFLVLGAAFVLYGGKETLQALFAG